MPQSPRLKWVPAEMMQQQTTIYDKSFLFGVVSIMVYIKNLVI